MFVVLAVRDRTELYIRDEGCVAGWAAWCAARRFASADLAQAEADRLASLNRFWRHEVRPLPLPATALPLTRAEGAALERAVRDFPRHGFADRALFPVGTAGRAALNRLVAKGRLAYDPAEGLYRLVEEAPVAR